MTADYPRDLVGYGGTVPDAAWPDGARVAVQFVLNYEEGAERRSAEDIECYVRQHSAFDHSLEGTAGCMR